MKKFLRWYRDEDNIDPEWPNSWVFWYALIGFGAVIMAAISLIKHC